MSVLPPDKTRPLLPRFSDTANAGKICSKFRRSCQPVFDRVGDAESVATISGRGQDASMRLPLFGIVSKSWRVELRVSTPRRPRRKRNLRAKMGLRARKQHPFGMLWSPFSELTGIYSDGKFQKDVPPVTIYIWSARNTPTHRSMSLNGAVEDHQVLHWVLGLM